MNAPMATDLPPHVAAAHRKRRSAQAGVKLWLAVVAANFIGLVVAVYASMFIRAIPESAGAETGMRFAYYAMMLVVAIVDALWLDEMFFKGAFRITHIQGLAARFARDEQADVDQVAASMQRSNVSFPLLVVGCGAITYVLFNAVNHDFDGYWRSVGRHASTLRGSDPEHMPERIDAIKQLSMNFEPQSTMILLDALERDDEVAAWSAWALGRRRDTAHARHLIKPLVKALRSEDEALRLEAMIALGRLQHRPVADELRGALTAQLDAGEKVDVRLIWALGYVQHTDSFPVLERALHHTDPEVARVAAWALAQHRDQRRGRAASRLLADRLPAAPFEVRCSIVHGLEIMQDEASNRPLMHAWNTMTTQERLSVCEKHILNVSPDGTEDPHELSSPETYAIKTLDAMGRSRATDPELRAEVEPWLEAIGEDQDLTLATRESAQSLLAGIRDVRNDIQEPE